MVAERDNESIRYTRASALIAVAKAKIYIEEGWKTYIVDEQGRNFEQAEFHLLPAVLAQDPGSLLDKSRSVIASIE